MNAVNLFLALIALSRELIKYLREREEKSVERVRKIRNMKVALRKARNDKDTSSLEHSLLELGLLSNKTKAKDD